MAAATDHSESSRTSRPFHPPAIEAALVLRKRLVFSGGTIAAGGRGWYGASSP